MSVATLHEPPRRYGRGSAMRESELSRLWEAQRFPPEALVTDAGSEVRVVYRGRRGAGAGPDFRDALIGTEGAALLRGDVELHVRSSDFRRHGHHLDRGYLRLALHVVFEHDGGPTALLDGRIVPTVALGRWVERRAGELRSLLSDPTSYQEPCHTAVARLGVAAVSTVLEEMGTTRLRERAVRLLPVLDSEVFDWGRPDAGQALYTAIARALGLTRNCAPMDAVATALPLTELRVLADGAGDPRLAVEAALLGTSGLLEGQFPLWADGDSRSRQHLLLAAWQAQGSAALTLPWADGLQRPGCAPADRLAGLAALVCRAGPPLDASLADWRALMQERPGDVLACLQVPRAIGRDRAVEIATNALLPWLLATFPGDPVIEAGVIAVYRALPSPLPYGQTKLLAAALTDAGGRSLVHGPQRLAASQGALQMTRDWCTQGGCGHCPLS